MEKQACRSYTNALTVGAWTGRFHGWHLLDPMYWPCLEETATTRICWEVQFLLESFNAWRRIIYNTREYILTRRKPRRQAKLLSRGLRLAFVLVLVIKTCRQIETAGNPIGDAKRCSSAAQLHNSTCLHPMGLNGDDIGALIPSEDLVGSGIQIRTQYAEEMQSHGSGIWIGIQSRK